MVNPPALPDESPRDDPSVPEPDAVHEASSPPEPTPIEASEPAPEPGHSAPLELPAHRGRRRPTRLGLRIQFEARDGDPELGRLVETTVWVNAAHPAYQRAVASRAESYHLALTVAMALAKVAVEPAQEHDFVAAFLGRWGEAGGIQRKPRSRMAAR